MFFFKVPDFEKSCLFPICWYPESYHLCSPPTQTPPKFLVLLFWDAKPYQMGLENVSFSVGGLNHGGTLCVPFKTSRHQWTAREERA